MEHTNETSVVDYKGLKGVMYPMTCSKCDDYKNKDKVSLMNNAQINFTKLLSLTQVQQLIAELAVKVQKIVEIDLRLLEGFIQNTTFKEFIVVYPMQYLIIKAKKLELDPVALDRALDVGLDELTEYALNELNWYLLAGVDLEMPIKEVEALKIDPEQLGLFKNEVLTALEKIKGIYQPKSKSELKVEVTSSNHTIGTKLNLEDPWKSTIVF